ncbi:LrgB family protein [Anaeromicrobium sediminis]|uniref:CidB/LrgB family autolysis modulator n=1 Tax=Anaeromicrobium sediminis TaxID=1478221 RepID=A0A267MFG9_9FIRM|nr:LrgB family protein [Anaeromicrobium sediminis]PAB57658.1 hypothetical protein CCE28_18525 [Anaeromicrobium sediminis]
MKGIFLNNPFWGVSLSLGAFIIGVNINEKIKSPIVNPLLIGSIIIIVFLKFFSIDYEIYKEQNEILNFLLGPATVILAVPLYKSMEVLKKNIHGALMGILIGTIVSIVSVVGLAIVLGASEPVLLSLAPKAVTTPIAMEVSRIIGGIPPLTTALVAITGIFGASFGPEILRFFKVDNEIAMGIAIGTTTHALGTTRALQEGELVGAMSSLSIGIAGLVTAFMTPYIIEFVRLYFI